MLLMLAFTMTTVTAMAQQATQQNPSKTDWFVAKKYGVFIHYLAGIQNNPGHVASLGQATSWDECVRQFNVETFAERLHEAGAGYAIITMLQRQKYMIAPNATYDRLTGYKPGEACATRDLVEDLYQALHKRDIALMLYWTGDGPCDDPQASKGMGWPADERVNETFVRNWASVAREYGERYRDKVQGWWTDGCYQYIGYDDAKLGILAEGLRAGYPDRIIALNCGVKDRNIPYTRHEDYMTGEQNSFRDLPTARFVGGEQWHILSFLGNMWAQPGTCCGDLRTNQPKPTMIDYVHAVNALGGVVTIDVVGYRDGELDRSQLEVLKAIRPGLKAKEVEMSAWREGKAVPPNNKAWHKPALLLSGDGNRMLLPHEDESYGPRCAVDGNPHTRTKAAGDAKWTYEVNFLKVEPLRRVVVTFGKERPAEFELSSSPDGVQWKTLGSYPSPKDGRAELEFAPFEAKALRVHATKPNEKNEPMSIVELEVYE
jgi:hypothetical protein